MPVWIQNLLRRTALPLIFIIYDFVISSFPWKDALTCNDRQLFCKACQSTWLNNKCAIHNADLVFDCLVDLAIFDFLVTFVSWYQYHLKPCHFYLRSKHLPLKHWNRDSTTPEKSTSLWENNRHDSHHNAKVALQ